MTLSHAGSGFSDDLAIEAGFSAEVLRNELEEKVRLELQCLHTHMTTITTPRVVTSRAKDDFGAKNGACWTIWRVQD